MDFLFEGEGLQFQQIIQYPNFHVRRNRVTFLTGPSGVGKSTLLRMFNRTITPSAGELRYCEKSIADYSPITLRREVLLISQEVFLFVGSIRDNFVRFYQYRELPPPDDAQMKEWLSVCALSMSLDALCDSLSGGERQRVMLAIYLSLKPSVLLLDEPTSALDFVTASMLLEHLLAYAKQANITPIIVSHTGELIERFAQEQILLKGGGDLWEQNN